MENFLIPSFFSHLFITLSFFISLLIISELVFLFCKTEYKDILILPSRLLIVLFIIVSSFAIYYTKGKSIYISCIILMIFLFLNFKGIFSLKSFNLNINWTTVFYTIVVLCLTFILNYYKFIDLNFEIKDIHGDNHFYGRLADYLLLFKTESTIFSEGLAPLNFYHYFEIWLTAMSSLIAGSSGTFCYILIVNPILSTLIFLYAFDYSSKSITHVNKFYLFILSFCILLIPSNLFKFLYDFFTTSLEIQNTYFAGNLISYFQDKLQICVLGLFFLISALKTKSYKYHFFAITFLGFLYPTTIIFVIIFFSLYLINVYKNINAKNDIYWIGLLLLFTCLFYPLFYKLTANQNDLIINSFNSFDTTKFYINYLTNGKLGVVKILANVYYYIIYHFLIFGFAPLLILLFISKNKILIIYTISILLLLIVVSQFYFVHDFHQLFRNIYEAASPVLSFILLTLTINKLNKNLVYYFLTSLLILLIYTTIPINNYLSKLDSSFYNEIAQELLQSNRRVAYHKDYKTITTTKPYELSSSYAPPLHSIARFYKYFPLDVNLHNKEYENIKDTIYGLNENKYLPYYRYGISQRFNNESFFQIMNIGYLIIPNEFDFQKNYPFVSAEKIIKSRNEKYSFIVLK